MRKAHIIMLSLMLATPAFAAVVPEYTDDTINYIDADNGAMVDAGMIIGTDGSARRAIPSGTSVRPATSLRAASRSSTYEPASTNRSIAQRGAAVARTGATTNAARGTQRATVSRTSNTNPARVSMTTTKVQAQTMSGGVRPASVSARTPSIASVSVNNNNAVTTIAETVKTVTENLDSLAELSDYCKSQYTQCMDNFCNVLDDNQGRCSCSKNVKNYEKTESALRAATEELQDVAQRIQYIGLTAEEINMLFTQTEAEIALQSASDNSKIKNDLDRIKNMIVNVKSGSSSAAVTENSGISIDFSNLLSFNIDSYGFDLSGLFGTTTTQNTQSIGNQRGEALYKSAAARCKTAVLNNCSAQGVDVAVMVNAYDMEIDRQCIQYERALTDSNNQMLATVRNAKTVLQKARLMISQQKNQYDLRGCVSALDSCMQDDYVCGNDYEECLDPTGRYIVDGEVVVGSMPGMPRGDWRTSDSNTTQTTRAFRGLYTVWNVGGTGTQNIWAPEPKTKPYTIAQYIGATLNEKSAQTNAPKDISEFLQTKIGYNDGKTGRNYGMCMSVLNKCQDYTYKNGKYDPKNQIISEYMQRAFRQIKASQDNVLSKYASNCLSDVSACLSQNNYGFGASTSGNNNYSDIAIRACLPVINTCRSVTLGLSEADVSTDDFSDIYVWLDAGIGTTYQEACELTGGVWEPKTASTYNGMCTCSGDNAGTGLYPASGMTGSDPNPGNKTCVCASGTPYRSPKNNRNCVDEAQYNCENASGTWANGTCACPSGPWKNNACTTCDTGETWNGTNCVAQTTGS